MDHGTINSIEKDSENLSYKKVFKMVEYSILVICAHNVDLAVLFSKIFRFLSVVQKTQEKLNFLILPCCWCKFNACKDLCTSPDCHYVMDS